MRIENDDRNSALPSGPKGVKKTSELAAATAPENVRRGERERGR